MIRKLRRKLIITSMASLFLVLLVIEGIVGVLNYRKIVTDADGILNILEQNDGKFPQINFKKFEEKENGNPAVPSEENPGDEHLDDKNKMGMMSEEMPYESRFFSVILNEEGEMVTADTGKIASVDTSAAAGHGVVSKDDLVLTSGTYEINAEKHGLSGKDSVRISEGTYHITAGKDGIHASNTDDSSQGFIYIAGGNFEITADDDGMHADSSLLIEGGTIHVEECYEGLEGLSIDITGGDIDVTSGDDGLNAAGGNDSSGFGGRGGDMFAVEEGAYIHISGGTLHVNASGDGTEF